MIRLASTEGIEGTIKNVPEDFIVEEIAQNGTLLTLDKEFTNEELGLTKNDSGKFCIFILQKNNWNTVQALVSIAKRFKRGKKSIAFAGTKDRTAITTQLCAIFGVKSEELALMHLKDVKINGAWNSDIGVEVGDLVGNSFAITIRDCKNPENIERIVSELNGLFPNYFGEQRFGYRNNNSQIGLKIIKDDFEGAALEYLTGTTNETMEDAVEARKRLAEERDFKKALEYFPSYLKYEKSVIEYLSRYPGNYANALRKLPRQISLMFIHSLQAEIFNKELEERIVEKRLSPEEGEIVCKSNNYGFPDIENVQTYDKTPDSFLLANIVGYQTEQLTASEEKIMGEIGVDKSEFKIKAMPELSSKGAVRVMFAPYRNFSYEIVENSLKVRFSLQAGAYATSFLKEIL